MQRLFQALTLLAIICITSNGLFAAPEQDKSASQTVFQQLDKNSDGIVNADEVPKDKERFFDHLIRLGDQNQDGKLTKVEFESGLNKEKQKFPTENGTNRNRGPRDFQAFMSRLDRNGDKKITKDEIPEPLKKRLEPLFQRLNKEEISLDELKNYGAKFRSRKEGNKKEGDQRKMSSEMSDRIFQRMDSNKDGKLTVDETSERGKRFLSRMLEQSGKDAEGSFTKKEFTEALAKFRPDRRPQGRSDNKDKQEMKRPGKRDKETTRRRTDSAGQRPSPAFVRILDANKDGKLSKDELNQMKTLFEKLDRNKDGNLDLREMMGGDRMNRPRRPEQNRPKRDKAKNES